jgi:hypothetical protein
MANFSVTPMSLTFPKVVVQGPVSGLYATPPTQTFTLNNTSGASVTITNYGFSTSTEGDAVTQPAGVLGNSDFTVIPTASTFPITIANGAGHSFTVTYSPLRRASGFGDVRSAILALFAGNKALTNGSKTWAQNDNDSFVSSLNPSGEVVDMSVPIPVTVGVGGGVIEEGYDWPSVHPMYWTAGVAATGAAGIKNNVQGMSAVSTLADMDTTAHHGVMLFWAPLVALPTAAATSATTPWTPRASAFGGSPFGVATPGAVDVPSNVDYIAGLNYDYGTPRGGRSYQILVFFTDDTQAFDLTISAVVKVPSNPTLVAVKTWIGLTYATASGLFIGNNEGLDLQGLTLVATTANYAGTAAAYNVGAVRTA